MFLGSVSEYASSVLPVYTGAMSEPVYPISVSLAMANLEELCAEISALDSAAREKRAVRDTLIKSATDNDVKYRTLMRVTGLSRDRLFRIVGKGSHD